MALIDEITKIETMWIVNEKKREEQYREAARKYDCREWVKIIKTIYLRKKNRRLEGKKITYIDEKYMKMAEDNLYGEISLPLKLSPDEVERFIREKIGEEVKSKVSVP